MSEGRVRGDFSFQTGEIGRSTAGRRLFLWGTLSPLAAKGEIVDSKNIIGKVEYPGHQKQPIILHVPTKVNMRTQKASNLKG